MAHNPGPYLAIFAAAVTPALTAQPSQSQLTPRELFYNPVTSTAPGKQLGKTQVKPRPQRSTAKPTAPPTSQQTADASTSGEAARIVPATAQALGLKYVVTKLANGRAIEVPADTVFHSGDAIQIKVETNGPGYLYVVNKGSSGSWTPMFPSPKIAGGNNRVDGFQSITLPNREYQMTFDEHTGVENLAIVFSREPVPDFEDLIYSLQDRSKPSRQPSAAPSKAKIVVAEANIDDATVGRLRSTYSRDLIIEKVTPATPADSSDKKETAVYVVNPKGSPDSRLVADIQLRHQ